MLRSAPLAPPAMHAPDGFFSVWLSIVGWVIAAALIALALRNTRDQLGERQVPLMGIMAAAIFAGQMLNFTIPGGTSGHLIGGALAAIVLGPWAGLLVMTAVVAVQALLFQDGGLLVMGLNIINMGVITAFVGYFVYRLVRKIVPGRAGLLVGAAAGAWLSLVVTAAFAAVELALSGTSPLRFALPAMVGVHALIGVGEALLTVFALGFILAARPDLVTGEEAPGQRSAGWVTVGLVLALAITLLAPLASPYSDGMERVAEVFAEPQAVERPPVGFAVPSEPQFFGEFRDAPYEILPDYTVPFLGDSGVSTIVAGMIGVLIVFGVALGVARLTRRGERARP
ncbi:MAG TPA: energy-coupling factor ABC transporter permease [Aggregatilineales bacterium]|nr:energy-coupling factor ABC transporter permease [Aggregatilineales bacterium]